MKLKVSKCEAKTKELHLALLEKGKLSVAEIMDLLKVNRQSVYNYLKRLENSGVLLSSEIVGHSTVYSIAKSDAELEKYEAIDKNVLRTFSTVRLLQQKPVKVVELYKGLNMDFSYSDDDPLLDIGRTQFDKLLRSMLEGGLLTKEGKMGILYPSGEQVPVILELTEDDAWELNSELERVPEGFPYYSALESLYVRMNMLIGNTEQEKYEYQHTFGKKLVNFEKINESFSRLPLKECFSKVARFSNGGKHSIYLATGLIVYCAEKDKLYLLGRQANYKGKLKDNYVVLDVDKLQIVEPKEIPNPCLQSDSFKKQSQDMFSVSDAKPVYVKVEFDNIFNIKRKVEGLRFQRKSAVITKNGDKLIYEDMVSGLPDLANYLRQYGDSCRVIEPESLKKIMKETVVKSLSRYEEAGYGEEL